ncbi:outer membrane beta-barrel protein [Oxalobacteraceae bacterium A2-2]
MKKIILAVATAASALSGISLAHADEAGTGYVGVGIVGSRFKYDVPATGGDDNSVNKAGGKIYGGYNIDKTWAIEGGYTDFGSKGYNYNLNGANGRIESDAHSFYLAGKGTVPVNEQFNVFGKLGVARNHNSVDATGAAAGLGGSGNKNALYASVGGEYAINKQVSLSLEYEHYGKNDNDLGRKTGAITGGLRYSF